MSINDNFIESIKPKIAERLMQDNPKCKRKGNEFNGLKCPKCGQPEAFTNLDKGLMIFCHSNNKCGAQSPIKKVYPDLFSGNFAKEFKPTKEDPKAPATAYLQSRGIKTEGLEYSLSLHSASDGGKHHTIVFKIDDDTKFHRFIDYQGKDKTRNVGSITGKVYRACTDTDKEIFIVEGIIDALSLKQAGKPAIAILGCSNLPEQYYLDCKKKDQNQNFIIALDNDPAGHKGIRKHIEFFQKNKINYSIILAPAGKDWNDLLQSNQLGECNFEYYEWLGRLFCASTARDWYMVYCSYYDKTKELIFCHHNQTYEGKTKTEKAATENQKEEKSYHIKRLANCSMEIVYTTINNDQANEYKTQHLIKLVKHNGLERNINISSDDFATPDAFRKRLLSAQCIYYSDLQDLLSIFSKLDDKKRPIVRKFDYTGYDQKSGCYVNPFFLYDKEGKRHSINSEGYFDEFNIEPLKSKDDRASFVSGLEEIDLKLFIEQLYGAYNSRGLIVFSFYVSSLFSHLIYEKFNEIPILSTWGEAHSGKTDLTTICRNFCFFIKEGFNPKGSKKGIDRTLSKFVSTVIAITEGQDSDILKIDILSLFHRGNVIHNATYSNNKNTYIEILQSNLHFNQNPEIFHSTEQELTRVISLQFKKDQNNDNTKVFHSKLKSYSQNQLAYIGHSILSNRKYFEQNIVLAIEETIKEYMANDILKSMERVRFNYSMILGTLNCFLDCFKFPEDKATLYLQETSKTLLEMAKKTALNCEANSLISDEFFSLLFKLPAQESSGYAYCKDKDKEDELRINKPLAESAITQVYSKSWNSRELASALKRHKGFTEYKNAKLYTHTEKCYIYSKKEFDKSMEEPTKPKQDNN